MNNRTLVILGAAGLLLLLVYNSLFVVKQTERAVLLRFGAVDWSCRVWLNGFFLGEHEGGYTPFEFDLTDLLNPVPGENHLVVRVLDPCDLDPQIPRGKQGGLWYACASGIWQTVYLEPVPDLRVTAIQVLPQPWDSSLRLRLRISSPESRETLQVGLRFEAPDGEEWEVSLPWGSAAPSLESEFNLVLERQRLWSPEDPALYGLEVRLLPIRGESDRVRTYFGQRWVGTEWVPGHSPAEQPEADRQYQSVTLNGKPVFIRGLLDQSYNPEGIYSYLDEESLQRDLLLAKEQGFNFLRLHIKIDEPRRIYWADRLGLLLMVDIPCVDQFAVNTADSRGRPLWEGVLRGAVERDFNHPSIVAWCDFNETWGLTLPLPLRFHPGLQDWVRSMWNLTRELDPTRLVEDNSPTDWFRDHVVTDLNSWHFYLDGYEEVKDHLDRIDRDTYPGSPAYFVGGARQDGAPLLCSEFGPVSAFGGDRDISWGLKSQVNELRRHDKICGYVFTELTDVEWEHNGLFRYDRSPKEFGFEQAGITLRDLTGADFLVIHGPPGRIWEPGADFSLSVAVSSFSPEPPPGDVGLFWKLKGFDDLGRPVDGPEGGPVPVRIEPLGLSESVTLEGVLPALPMTGDLLIRAQSATTGWQVANYLPVHLYGGQLPRAERRAPREWVVRWDPGAGVASQWSGGPVQLVFAEGSPVPEAVAGKGAGAFEYRVPCPGVLRGAELERVTLLWEASAAPGSFNPQTDRTTTPTTLSIRLNGIDLGQVTLPDAPADARGFLSYLHEGAPRLYGSYGYLVSVEVPVADLPLLRERLEREGTFTVRLETAAAGQGAGNGLRLYGDLLGRYGVDPSLVIRTASD